MSKDTISRSTGKVFEEMSEWCNRPLDHVYPVIFMDALVRPHRTGPNEVGDASEAGVERLRHQLPGTHRPLNNQLNHNDQLHQPSDSP
ncbi:hypothetical protein GCM10009676_38270 [Prauserella halophila]|uniref:Mutator family transposase n=1 Tax=Prauserella halophila TaxID=185641 RepID=A0ABN1WLH0_9PSEU